jgi:outer membrane protein TolC
MNQFMPSLSLAAAMFWMALPVTTYARSQDPSESVSIPSSKDKQTAVSSSAEMTRQMELMAKLHDYSFVDSKKSYTLPELVDLAQRHNPTTRISWEIAVQAAASTGLSEAQFYPTLTVASSYGGGYWSQDLTGAKSQSGIVVPVNFNDKASGNYSNLSAGVNLRYTLFDFGQRIANTKAAKRTQAAANLSFNATHQQITFQVTQAYYTLETDRRLIETAEISAKSADDVLASTQAKYDQGLLTEPVLLQAKQAQAQSEFDLVNARSNWEVARLNLIQVIGAEPECGLKIAPYDFSRLDSRLQAPLDQFVQSAMKQKPDLLAKVAQAQAAEQSLRATKAGTLPQFSIKAIQSYQEFSTTINGSAIHNVGLSFQNYGGSVNVEWPFFDGGLDRNKVKQATSSLREANEAVLLAREEAVATVWRSYTTAKTSLQRKQSADDLLKASQSSYEALLASFNLGRTQIQDLLNARASLAQAMATKAECDQSIAASLATLAYASGQL